jgi:hypothetical protein
MKKLLLILLLIPQLAFSQSTWNQYFQLMDELSKDKYIILPLNEMRKIFDSTKVIVGLRHDIDNKPERSLEMARIEKGYGFRATYFILNKADSIVKQLHRLGMEIGIHNDLLTVMIFKNTNPFEFNRTELKHYKKLRIPIYGTASHGSQIAKETIPNYQIFKDYAKSEFVKYKGILYPLGRYSLSRYGFKYEAYFINFNIYLSDSGGQWNDNKGFAGVMDKIKNSKQGDRIQILVHPEWWK